MASQLRSLKPEFGSSNNRTENYIMYCTLQLLLLSEMVEY